MNTIDQALKISSFVGEYEIVGNGCAPSLIDMPLKLKINDLTFEFNFISDSDNKETKVTKRNVDGKVGIFDLINFDNPLGTGALTPWHIGTISGRKLYISFWIWTPSSNDGKRIIDWTLMLDQIK
ncbi:hypothetical protein FNO01nite_33940 [Flavobacterium noncentrifugens]|uniref:Uncharacterized protein n=1 Tax=Flavobacterium noncentrifugens TaxID=1128970 RepID=A0A1G9DD54_9FLAO|nr:hypothetical protein [Flavobacterium noncentrifugens]GEP52722.1 hypothetical protein FNO01nite_33940 [Flavobacterium noncentrifugens]SDK61737.1 hypothetical protein SAMN04487935_3785 [Flavobacterium noncentrifugens]